jgi:phosphatidylserine/phosphatidylglycerophosphate/cardiolipin synthase-like enzyme
MVAGTHALVDDGRMRRAAFTPATPIWTTLLVVLALCLGGCASQPGTVDAAEALLDLPPDGAFYREGQLVLQYSSGPDKVFLTASWPVDGLRPDRHTYHTAVMDLATDPPAAPATLQHDWQSVTLLGYARWQALMGALLQRLTPADPATGTLVTVQGADFVLHRDGGGLKSTRLEDKPASLRVGRRVSEEAFAEQANDWLKAQLAPDGGDAGPVLFAVGEDELGGAFVLFDFARRQSVFIAQPPSPLPPGRQLGFSLRLVDALTLRSHVFSALRHPVTMTHRLFWLTTHTGAVLVPRGVTAAAGAVLVPRGVTAAARAVPRLAGGEGIDPEAWERQLDELVGTERYRGSMQPLIDGEAFFVSLVQAIQEARDSIDIRLYIFDTDDYALRIADLLRQRSHEVRVRVLIDRIGTLTAGQVPKQSPYYSGRQPPLSIADYLRRDSKVEVRVVNNPWLTSDHTKVIAIDGTRIFLGGMNIGREYRYEWHDLMVEVKGPIVGRLRKDFDKRWAHTGLGGDLAFFIASLKKEPGAAAADGTDTIDIRPLYTRTGDAQILRAQLAAIRRAKARIYIEQPYLSDDELIAELIRARRRGVDVRVVLPTRNDSGFMNSANLLAARAFLANGIRVYGYPGMTHVKAALYDGWATVGSANFDKLSLRIKPGNQPCDFGSALRRSAAARPVRGRLRPFPGMDRSQAGRLERLYRRVHRRPAVAQPPAASSRWIPHATPKPLVSVITAPSPPLQLWPDRSMCSHGVSPTKRDRKRVARMWSASPSMLHCLTSATVESRLLS